MVVYEHSRFHSVIGELAIVFHDLWSLQEELRVKWKVGTHTSSIIQPNEYPSIVVGLHGNYEAINRKDITHFRVATLILWPRARDATSWKATS